MCYNRLTNVLNDADRCPNAAELIREIDAGLYVDATRTPKGSSRRELYQLLCDAGRLVDCPPYVYVREGDAAA